MANVPSFLVVSKSLIIQRLIADVPFLAAGVVSFAVSLLLVMKRRINLMTSMIMLSSFFSFVAALLDLIILVGLSNQPRDSTVTPSTFGNVTARVVREMFLACAITLRFLFFWHIVGLPARGEVSTPVTTYPPDGSFIPSHRDLHSGNWLQWGIFGVVLKYFMVMAVVAVGVLEAIWRLEFVFLFVISAATMESASATLEVALSVLFMLKLLGNLLFTSARRLSMLLGFLPVLVAMAISTGVAAGTLAVGRFMDYPLGRLLQALQLYILSQYVLFVAFDDVGPLGESFISPPEDEKRSTRSRRVSAAESFSAVQVLSDDLVIIPPTRPSESVSPPTSRRPSRPNRPISAERIASWVSRRLSGRPSDGFDLPYLDRPAAPKDGYTRARTESTSSMLRSKEDGVETIDTHSIYSRYTMDDSERLAGAVNKPVSAPRRSEVFTVPAVAPPVPKLNLKEYQAHPESPIYGLNGPIRPPLPTIPEMSKTSPLVESATAATQRTAALNAESRRTETLPRTSKENPAVESAANLMKVIEEFSAEGLQLPDPSINTGKSLVFSDISSPRSGGSRFSLDRFPLPPALASGRSDDETQTVKPNRDSGSGSDIEAAFELVVPRPSDPRLQSFPSTMRDSDVDLPLSPGVIRTGQNDRYRYPGREITSFIDGEMTRGDREIADARAISRILSRPTSPGQTRLPIGVVKDDKRQTRIFSGSNKTEIPQPKLDNASLPANPRPLSRTGTPADTSPRTRPPPNRPQLQEQSKVRGQFQSPRLAPAPS